MHWIVKNWMLFAFVALVVAGEWMMVYQPIARECRRRGGSYTLDGTCSVMTFRVIFNKHDLK